MTRITFAANPLRGRPCIRGLRIRVQDVLELSADRESADSIRGDCPCLEREDIRACPASAAAEAGRPILRTG
ncbi:DUF433 domain-containing protein [Nocardia sp. BMG111209]|uniref:DUF433 domain-containing protein n=1 Tax=Nocardia sp. BMG111209 TaxID=1160137 RepID=UPI0009DC1577|nr:DUF433 domain-containing protein [Nocardia sp. BMG111209]